MGILGSGAGGCVLGPAPIDETTDWYEIRRMEMKKALVVCMVLVFSLPAMAEDIGFTTNLLVQGEFDSFVKEFGAGISFNPMGPAEPLGVTGFDVAVEVVLTDISDGEGYWTKMIADNNPHSFLPAPRLHVQKGLPFGIDVGAIYAAMPGYDVRLWGLEAKYAILEGSVATPALSIRGSFSLLGGVDDIDLNTKSIDLLVSKGFLMLTPYAGVSALWISGSENSSIVSLKDAEEALFRGILGLQFSPMPLVAATGEIVFGDVVQYGLKIAIRF